MTPPLSHTAGHGRLAHYVYSGMACLAAISWVAHVIDGNPIRATIMAIMCLGNIRWAMESLEVTP